MTKDIAGLQYNDHCQFFSIILSDVLSISFNHLNLRRNIMGKMQTWNAAG